MGKVYAVRIIMKLSPTAKEQYLRCPLAYYMKYILGFKEELGGSPLIIGSANDAGTEALLQGKTMEEAKRIHDDALLHPTVNGVVVDSMTSDKIKWSKSDLKNSPIVSDNPAEVWVAKGHMILEQYAKQVMPKIKSVLGTQIRASIKNELGDEGYGFADFIYEHVDGRIILADNKTAGKRYDDAKVLEMMPQLAFYEEALRDEYKIDQSEFIVMVKDIRKTERNGPRVVIQDDLVFDIPEEIFEKTFADFEEVMHNIRMGRFESNHPDCHRFYGPCLCSIGDNGYFKSGGVNLTGLVKVERRSK